VDNLKAVEGLGEYRGASCTPRVYGVIVSFDPDQTIIESVRQLTQQVAKIIIVDNGSAENGKRLVDACCQVSSRIEIIWNEQNLGIAAALNQGVDIALRENADWILTLDDDSVVEDQYVVRLLQAYENCRDRYPGKRIGIIVPRYVYQGKPAGKKWSKKTRTDDFCWLKEAITSGNLVRLEVYRKAGLYRKEMFIDYVDNEFCLRIRRLGYEILEAGQATLKHAMGKVQTTKIAGIPVVYTTYSPERRYYKTRNRIWCCKTYLFRNPGWVLKDLFLLFREILKITVTEQERVKHLRYVFKGFADGLRSRDGKLVA
jgi:rhamnosyltransferase